MNPHLIQESAIRSRSRLRSGRHLHASQIERMEMLPLSILITQTLYKEALVPAFWRSGNLAHCMGVDEACLAKASPEPLGPAANALAT